MWMVRTFKIQAVRSIHSLPFKGKQTPPPPIGFRLGELHLIFVISSHIVICWYQIPNHRTPGIFMSTRSHKLVAKYYIRHAQNQKTHLVNTKGGVGRKW